jgi:hypothetical protein
MRLCKQYLLAGTGVAAAMALSAAFAQAGAQQSNSQISFIPPADSVCGDCAKPDGRANPSPPAGFQPLTATAQQLAHFGFPPRPDARKDLTGYRFWARMVSLPQERVIPHQQATTLYNRPAIITAQNLRPSKAGGATGSKSGNWSGYAVVSRGKGTPFQAPNTYVYGNFTVPVAQEAFGTCAGQVYSSEWVGIDGYGSNDVFQAGIEADASCHSGARPTKFYSAWYEWYPKSETRVSEPKIQAGDEIMLYIWNESRTVGDYYMLNVTKQKSSTLQFDAPSGTQLAGNSVEWIVERPGVGGGLATLTNYVAAPWWTARAASPNGATFSPASGGGGNTLYSITMHDNDGAYISTGYTSPDRSMSYVAPDNSETLLPGTALWFFDEGSALNGQ